MRTLSPFMQSFEQLPATLPIFPLANAIVLPGSNLPLNIFEPRYLNMLQDAMQNHRLIGMIQPRDESNEPALYQVGCAGRITRYQETSDGRLEITLTGLCRFRVAEELSTTRGYRLIKPGWQEFAMDYEEPGEAAAEDRNLVISALRKFIENNNMPAEWEILEKLSTGDLTNSLLGILPLTKEDKQMLIETDTLAQRTRALGALLEDQDNQSSLKH